MTQNEAVSHMEFRHAHENGHSCSFAQLSAVKCFQSQHFSKLCSTHFHMLCPHHKPAKHLYQAVVRSFLHGAHFSRAPNTWKWMLLSQVQAHNFTWHKTWWAQLTALQAYLLLNKLTLSRWLNAPEVPISLGVFAALASFMDRSLLTKSVAFCNSSKLKRRWHVEGGSASQNSEWRTSHVSAFCVPASSRSVMLQYAALIGNSGAGVTFSRNWAYKDFFTVTKYV